MQGYKSDQEGLRLGRGIVGVGFSDYHFVYPVRLGVPEGRNLGRSETRKGGPRRKGGRELDGGREGGKEGRSRRSTKV